MSIWCTFILTAVSLTCFVSSEAVLDQVFTGGHHLDDDTTVSIHSQRDESGEWVTTVTAYHDTESTSNSTNLDVKRRIVSRDGKQFIRVTATIKDKPDAYRSEKLRFNEKGGSNVIVTNGGMTVTKLNGDDVGHGGVLTNRPLMIDEMLEVSLDKFYSKHDTSLGIGVTYHNQYNIDYSQWMQCGTIMLYNNQLYVNGEVTRKNYGPNLRTLRVGDRVGVAKKRNGDIHFYVNGADLGVAISDITYPVHGVADLYGKAVHITMV